MSIHVPSETPGFAMLSFQEYLIKVLLCWGDCFADPSNNYVSILGCRICDGVRDSIRVIGIIRSLFNLSYLHRWRQRQPPLHHCFIHRAVQPHGGRR